MLRYLLIILLASCAIEQGTGSTAAGSTAITANDLKDYKPIYVQHDDSEEVI